MTKIVRIDQFCTRHKLWLQTYVVVGARTISVVHGIYSNSKVFERPVRCLPCSSPLRKIARVIDKAERWKRRE